ncbi:MAG: F0F1 ATP synthase subunit delta [Gammaproteobacteria bacterium]|nr:F0F1 ATP synthase subunit delta [Gammaproteobacteria bacterium]MDE2251189.1 F0F1 ATP synthase subunit delta [Gammaproteobacteria bacterium]
MAERLTIARPYAKAVFALALAAQRLPQWSEALRVAAAVVADARVAQLLANPAVSAGQLVDLITGVGGAAFDERAKNFIRTLAANRRLAFLPEIAARYERLRAEAERTIDVTVTSAVELSAAQRQQYARAMQQRLGREVRLHCELDPALLGGAVVRADDLVIDGSVRAGLAQLAAATAG